MNGQAPRKWYDWIVLGVLFLLVAGVNSRCDSYKQAADAAPNEEVRP